MRYAVIIDDAGRSVSAYVPGCVATGATVEEVIGRIRDAIRFHVDGLQDDGLPIPEPRSLAHYVDV